MTDEIAPHIFEMSQKQPNTGAQRQHKIIFNKALDYARKG
jgi:hypothetical protein